MKIPALHRPHPYLLPFRSSLIPKTFSPSPMASFTHYSSPFPKSIQCSFKPKKPLKPIPVTDRVIDFGKYKGQMLGTLPSSYLKWVSKELRAGDFLIWAELADQVLQHPLYQDRLEWEFADSLMKGDRISHTSTTYGEKSEAAELLEISERFGWDNEDKIGWRSVNFELLGTSKGGRIPRISEDRDGEVAEEDEKVGGVSARIGGKRRERRERLLAKKEAEMRKDKMGVLEKYRGSLANGVENGERKIGRGVEGSDEDLKTSIHNRFPGREGLVREALNRKRFL